MAPITAPKANQSHGVDVGRGEDSVTSIKGGNGRIHDESGFAVAPVEGYGTASAKNLPGCVMYQ